MGTIVTIDVPAHAVPHGRETARDAHIDRALGWFRDVERRCSRFDPGSELMQLTQRPGEPVRVSPVLFEAVRFALAVAEDTDGAFDPTVGLRLERLGFNREHRTGRATTTLVDAPTDANWRDVRLDEAASSLTLLRPLVLDLGGVAKGMAIDLAARELQPLGHFGIDAGGDLYVAGRRANGDPWSVGIRHPHHDDQLLESIRVTDRAICTSGNYERQSATDTRIRHIIDARSGTAPGDILSATVVAPSAMLADALATAAFVLGPAGARSLLDRHGVCGLLFTSALERIVTEGCDGDGHFIR